METEQDIIPLNAPDRSPVPEKMPDFFLGQAYSQESLAGLSDKYGLCRGFNDSPAAGGGVQAWNSHVDKVFLWDQPECAASAGGNFFQLTNSRVQMPAIDGSTLGFHTELDFLFESRHFTASIGIIHLRQTQHFLLLEDGDKIELSDPQARTPYLASDQQLSAVHLLVAQASREATNYHRSFPVRYTLQQEHQGKRVETITLMQQYTSYFMQRAVPFTQDNIWVPLCTPINWGWSMRVGRRKDLWVIMRQKLLPPLLDADGIQMPSW